MIPSDLAKLKALEKLPQQASNRILFIPLSDLRSPDANIFKNEFTNNQLTTNQISAPFDKETSFLPLINNLIIFVKGQRPKFSESEITSKVINKLNFFGNSRLGKLNSSIRSQSSANKISSTSFEFID